MKKAIISTFIFLITASSVSAEVRLVPGDYPTIGAAVSACSDGDEVVVADGVYRGDGNRDLYINRDITVRSENGPGGCIIDCNGTETEEHRGFQLDRNCVIAGFTIINGYAEEGGAIYCGHDNSTIVNCVITDNSAERKGGGIYSRSGLTIINCKITGNSAGAGGGISFEGGGRMIINCKITGNSAGAGGGIYFGGGGATIKSCIISDNIATEDRRSYSDVREGSGGGICCNRSSVIITDSHIEHNSANYGGGGIYCQEYSNMTIKNCTISNNTAESERGESFGGGIYCGIYWGGNSNLTVMDSAICDNIVRANTSRGGGILFESSSEGTKLTILNCTINGNSLEGDQNSRGGGIFCNLERQNNFATVISECTIENNTAKREDNGYSYGGGIYCCRGRPIVTKCKISSNSATHGGGITCNQSSPVITGCVISGNFGSGQYKYYGGGIYCTDSSPAISNCTIVGNSFYGLRCRDGGANVISSIFCYNGRDNKMQINDHGNVVNVKYSDVQTREPEPWPGEGNINADPCFVESGYWDVNDTPVYWPDDFWVEGNYRLLATSPCIDSGCVTSYLIDRTDLDGNPRIIGQMDMGAYEFRNSEPAANAGSDLTGYACPTNGMAEVILDGSGSSDADGGVLSYLWTWVIDSDTYDANGANPVIELPVGQHNIELVVNDGTDNSEPDEVVITVVEPIESRLRIYSRLINRNNHRKKIPAYLSLPEGITKEQVDDSKYLLFYPGQIAAVRQRIIEYNRGGILHTAIVAFFNKDELMGAIADNGRVELQIVGQLKTGQYFYGDDSVWIKDR